jgi:hypothetical protein
MKRGETLGATITIPIDRIPGLRQYLTRKRDDLVGDWAEYGIFNRVPWSWVASAALAEAMAYESQDEADRRMAQTREAKLLEKARRSKISKAAAARRNMQRRKAG